MNEAIGPGLGRAGPGAGGRPREQEGRGGRSSRSSSPFSYPAPARTTPGLPRRLEGNPGRSGLEKRSGAPVLGAGSQKRVCRRCPQAWALPEREEGARARPAPSRLPGTRSPDSKVCKAAAPPIPARLLALSLALQSCCTNPAVRPGECGPRGPAPGLSRRQGRPGQSAAGRGVAMCSKAAAKLVCSK